MKVCIKTLGCKVNMYESEYLRLQAEKLGYEIVKDNADIYIINTCTVTNNSDAKSKKLIRRIRRENPNSIIIVMGCFSEYEKDNITDLIDANIIIGNNYKSNVFDLINEYLKTNKQIIKYKEFDKFEDITLDKFETKTRAYIKIEDGCENFCSYCIIPYVRGKVRSKDKEKVLEEVKTLVNNNHKEIVLTGIHTGHYGSDLNNYNFNDLLNDILKNNELKRLRISSIEITELTSDVLNTFKNNTVMARHFHVPLQSGCDKTLNEMNRKYDTNYFKDKIEKIRQIDNDTSITTDVIVGFPNETDEDFNKTYEFCKNIKFSKMHVFPYSERRGTKASYMDNKVDPKVIKQRANKLLELSNELEIEFNKKYLNKEVEVLIEEQKGEYFIGHTSNYLKVYIKDNLELNKLYTIKITSLKDNYLIGELIIKKN